MVGNLQPFAMPPPSVNMDCTAAVAANPNVSRGANRINGGGADDFLDDLLLDVCDASARRGGNNVGGTRRSGAVFDAHGHAYNPIASVNDDQGARMAPAALAKRQAVQSRNMTLAADWDNDDRTGN